MSSARERDSSVRLGFREEEFKRLLLYTVVIIFPVDLSSGALDIPYLILSYPIKPLLLSYPIKPLPFHVTTILINNNPPQTFNFSAGRHSPHARKTHRGPGGRVEAAGRGR